MDDLPSSTSLGAQVRKGERGATIVYYGDSNKTVRDENSGEDSEQRFRFLKTYTVFNVAQIDGLPERFHFVPEPAPEVERIEAAEAFFARIPATVNHGGDRAYYIPSADRIQLPPFAAFHDAHGYYTTRGHETVHWTNHKSRLDRSFGREKWGDEGYAREELVAELGAAFLAADLACRLNRAPIMPVISQAGLRSCRTTPAPSCKLPRTRNVPLHIFTNWRTLTK